MVQSLNNILNALPEKFCKQFSEIIIDEAHFSGAETWENIYNHFSHCLLFGMTATPLRYDNKSLSKYFNCIFEPIKISECIKKGYLSKPVIIIPELYKDHIPQNKEESEINKDIIQKGKIIGDMVKLYRDVFNGEPVIIPCSTTEHAKKIAEMYKSEKWIVDHIHSGLTKHERHRIIKDVRNGKTNILITVGVGVFGLNIVGLKGIIWLRYTESLTIFLQLCGRAARISKGKKHYILVDPVGNLLTHCSPDIDRKWSLNTDYVPGQDISEAPTMRICPVCDTANSQSNEKCWICGYDFLTALPVDKKKRKLPKFISGELVWLDNENNIERENDVQLGNNSNTGNDISTTNVHIKNSMDDSGQTQITHAQKIELLKRDLTGLKNRTRFRQGIKWL
jgi:superfamily II DNA or RNA helicase